VWVGPVWSFATKEYVPVDDFESYNDDKNCIFDTWIDGYTNKQSGSIVGYMQAPFAETIIRHGGKQSMPLEYNNVKAPYYSEATRSFSSAQDWTGNGATHLSLWFCGYPALVTVPVAETAGKMSLAGDGTDIWNNADDFVYAYKTLNGDGSIVARVISSGTGSNGWAKGGVMVRSSLDAGAAFADMVITGSSGSGNGASFQYRLAANGACGNTDAAAVVAPPYWVKIERKGDNITGSLSADGKTWSLLGTLQTIKMTGPVYIGLCVTSHQAGEQRTFQFDNIVTSSGVVGSWQGAQINLPRHNDAAGLYVVVEDSAGVKKVVAHPDPAAAATGTWTQWAIPLSDLTAAGVKATQIKRLTFGVGDRGNPKPDGVGMLYIDDIAYGHPAATK
jgi:hypothetical protein